MDMHLDTSWCPVCAREIMPKRYIVPAAPPVPPAPAPPPSSPSSSPSKAQASDNGSRTRSKNGTIRARGGLVHGTGRVKPNGAVKRSDSATAVKGATTPTQPPAAAPTKQRTIIDQGPIPLYCSDECRMQDINSMFGVLSIDHDPHRESLSTPAVPHNSFTNLRAAGSETESDSGSGGASSVDSCSSISWSSDSTKASSHVSPSIATLAAYYDFPPMPPPAPILQRADSHSSTESEHNFDSYQSGVMMAARRIKAALSPDPTPRRSAFNSTPTAPAPRGPIAGWTDGSGDWRTSVYSLSSPANAPKYQGDDKNTKAYRSTVASPHRSRGVASTMGDCATPTSNRGASTASLPVTSNAGGAPLRSASYAEDIYSKYPLSFSRRSDSRQSPYAASPSSLPASSSVSSRSASRRQEKSLLKPGAEGKLLVPDVKLKVTTSSLSLCDASSSSSWKSEASYPASSRRGPRSPLSRQGSEVSESGLSEASTQPDLASSLPTTRKPVVETRSWSYDNLMTYPVMQPAPKKEKRVERRIIDGKMKEVEVEVNIEQSFKRLFLFPGKECSI